MSTYDWTHAIDRTDAHSAKWDLMRTANPEVPRGIHPFSVADADLLPAPEIIEGLRKHLLGAVLGYPSVPASYTRAVIDWMRRRHDWEIEADWLVQTPGVVPALHTAVRALTDPGDGVIIQTPAYGPFSQAVLRNGRRLVENPLVLDGERWRVDVEGLRRLAADPGTRLLIWCSPHNPTGRVWTRAELEEVAAICLEHDLLIVSDEIHFDLVQPGHEHTVLTTLGPDVAERTVVCTAPSKTFNIAGLFTSNLVIPGASVRERIRDELASQGLAMLTTPGYTACEIAYTRCDAWLEEFLALIGTNHSLVRDLLAEQLPQVGVFPLEGTYLQWLDLRGTGLDAEALARLHQQEAHVFFDEGPKFGDVGAGFARMNLAAPTQIVREGLERFIAAHRRLADASTATVATSEPSA